MLPDPVARRHRPFDSTCPVLSVIDGRSNDRGGQLSSRPYTSAMALAERLVALTTPAVAVRHSKPRRVDWVVGGIFALLLVVEVAFDDLAGAGASAVLGLIAVGAFVWRRVEPSYALLALVVGTLAVDLAAGLVDQAIEPAAAFSVLFLTVMYSSGRWGSTGTAVVALLLGAAILPIAAQANPYNEPGLLFVAFNGLGVAVVIIVGLLIRARAEAKEQGKLAETLDERNRLANDIHDSFAHHMSAIAIRAEAARQLDDPVALDEALTAIKRSASTGLADMRHLVAGLRAPDDDTRPLPGFGDMQNLASELSSESLRVDLVVDVDPELIPVSTSATAYWIAREALTNVSRHATGATNATVRARGNDRYLDLTITDDGATPTSPQSAKGHGLRSMTERARALGGDLTAGPIPDRGWLVSARLPLNRGDG